MTAGGRADLRITVPADGARIDFGGTTALVLGDDPARGSTPPQPTGSLDLLSYGTPSDPGLAASDRIALSTTASAAGWASWTVCRAGGGR